MRTRKNRPTQPVVIIPNSDPLWRAGSHVVWAVQEYLSSFIEPSTPTKQQRRAQ